MCQQAIYHIKRLTELAWKGISYHRNMCYTVATNQPPTKTSASIFKSTSHYQKDAFFIFASNVMNYLKEILRAIYDLSSLFPKLDVEDITSLVLLLRMTNSLELQNHY